MPDPEQFPRRISVAVNADELAAIELLIDREHVSLTEAVRRLISYGGFMYRAVKVDRSELVVQPEGGKPKTVELL